MARTRRACATASTRRRSSSIRSGDRLPEASCPAGRRHVGSGGARDPRCRFPGAGSCRRGRGLELLLGAIAEGLEVESAVILVPSEGHDRLVIVASFGLQDAAVAGLAAAVGNPGHPIARTFATPVASFDVLPTAPGGPALRTHMPLVVTRASSEIVLGVLALAHEQPIDPVMRPILLAGADLAAVAIERQWGA